MTDIAFTSFAFATSGASTHRTMPDRLAEVTNVKDFGAVGDGVTNDTAAIQAAVNWTSGADRGTIYFPVGSYLVSAPITYNYNGNLSICFRGEVGTFINGNVNGYIFDRALGTPNNTTGGRIFERLTIQNANATGGCIRMGSTRGGVIRDCTLSGYTCITTEDSVGVSSENIHIQNCQFSLGSGQESGSHFIIIGGGGAIENCGLINSETAVRAYGSGLHCSGNRAERNDTVWLLGLDSGNNAVGLSGFSIVGSTFEGNWTCVDFAGPCDAFYIGSLHIQGHDDTNSGVQTPSAHGSQYGIRVRADCATNGVICGCDIGNWMEIANISIADATSRTNLVISCVLSQTPAGGGAAWSLPSNAYTATFENCNTYPLWTYSQLPTGGNVLEGDEFDITDSATNLWGDNVTIGGGSNRVRVRYNGTHWTVVGK